VLVPIDSNIFENLREMSCTFLGFGDFSLCPWKCVMIMDAAALDPGENRIFQI
jgi:hypothetical protein